MTRTHCSSGHPMTAENVYQYRNQRQCRECRKRLRKSRTARLRKSVNSPVDVGALARCREAMNEGVPFTVLKSRFGQRVVTQVRRMQP